MGKPYIALMPFVGDNDHIKFVHGFECGQIWQRMERGEVLKDYLFHTENTKQVEMMCRRFHYEFSMNEISETFSMLNARISEKAN